MKLHSLKPAAGSVKKGKRIARGQGSGHGGTATRGHKGAASRSGYSRKRGFEGGQMPLQRRLPKRGFKNINRVEYVAINFSNLEAICEKFQVTTVDPEFLYNNGFIKKTERIKILANGDLKSSLKISAHASSAKAKLTIEELGGSLTII